MEFAKGRDVVETGIGPGVRDHDQAVPHQHSATIGHSRSPARTLLSAIEIFTFFGRLSNPVSRMDNSVGDLSCPWRAAEALDGSRGCEAVNRDSMCTEAALNVRSFA